MNGWWLLQDALVSYVIAGFTGGLLLGFTILQVGSHGCMDHWQHGPVCIHIYPACISTLF